jgi:hypothetical protein
LATSLTSTACFAAVSARRHQTYAQPQPTNAKKVEHRPRAGVDFGRTISGENNNKINRIETGPAADRSRLSAVRADCYHRAFRQ